ncbi:MAG TPA: adenylate/guanylate cyclase domain-containing protein [Actinomycetota bacterium]|nr:adenylate/guanylate cyclase domain-containing protein [Actinomycetota bacterium]
MTIATETKYAMNGDLAVAYRIFGEGPHDMVLIGNWFTNVEIFPEVEPFSEMFAQLSSLGRIIVFDQPGSGASDPVTPDALPTLEQWTDSTRVVMDDVGVERAVLLAVDGAFATAAMFAATYPTRATALISLGGWARVRRSDDYRIGMTDEQIEAVLDLYTRLWGTGEAQRITNPDLPWNEDLRTKWARAERLAASPSTLRLMLRVSLELDVRHVLPLIKVPTLLLQHQDNPFVGRSGRYLAGQIPDSKCVDLPGQNLYPVGVDAMDEIREFLTGERGTREDDERILATVLFTDIVESTKRAADLGDRAWRGLLDAHDAIVRSQLARFRGREVKTVGDGFLATFDGPQRAIRCAVAIRDAVRALGLEVRAGVHTGECEVRGEDVGGIAVHIGARVSALAQGGEVLVSSTVRDLVVGSGLSFEDRGARELKGVPGTWNLYAVAA